MITRSLFGTLFSVSNAFLVFILKVIGNSSISCLIFQRGIPQALCHFLHIYQVLFIIIILLERGTSSDEKWYHGESLLFQWFYQIPVDILQGHLV